MTRSEAVALRVRHIRGEYVAPHQLHSAMTAIRLNRYDPEFNFQTVYEQAKAREEAARVEDDLRLYELWQRGRATDASSILLELPPISELERRLLNGRLVCRLKRAYWDLQSIKAG